MRSLKLSFSFISLAILLAITSVAAIANAQDEALSPAEERAAAIEERSAELQEVVAEREAAIQEAQANREEAITERREELQLQIEERRAALQERAQERITNLAANMSNRMEAAIERIQNVIDRLTSRIKTLAEEGVDTTSAESFLAESQNNLDLASSLISSIDAEVAAVVGSENPRENWQDLKALYTEIKTAIQASHQSLRDTVAALKGESAESQPVAETTLEDE
ncbi:MAG: hypothetical protein AAGA35_04015 [Patescibacteria group bacterium]